MLIYDRHVISLYDIVTRRKGEDNKDIFLKNVQQRPVLKNEIKVVLRCTSLLTKAALMQD